MMVKRTIRILGIRGLPAAHGGFETFAEYLSTYLIARGWRVIVYCQEEGAGAIYESNWQGIELIHIPVTGNGAKSTVVFDWMSTWHAAKEKDLCLTLGYNTAIFCLLLRLKGIPNIINMDGIEWKRGKWGRIAKTWFWLNEWAGSFLSNHMVADHPEIKRHLARCAAESKITMIPYGADPIKASDEEVLRGFGLHLGAYALLIARAEPENSILEVVQAYAKRPRGMPLVILGDYKPNENSYQAQVLAVANDEIKFIGAIYERSIVQALRAGACYYVHGHQVGGTNPSLVEALGAGNPVLAHDNHFNRWVVADAAVYFSSVDECDQLITQLCMNKYLTDSLKAAAQQQYFQRFKWDDILDQYEKLLLTWLPSSLNSAKKGLGQVDR
jgi:glycosyltransferase involved in cell wall biosynthesis